jgi:diacylglycerol kinase (ATP)
MKRKVSLIFNPVAGQGNPDVDLEAISSLLDSEIDLDLIVTKPESKPGDLAKAAIAVPRRLLLRGAMVPSPLWRRR